MSEIFIFKGKSEYNNVKIPSPNKIISNIIDKKHIFNKNKKNSNHLKFNFKKISFIFIFLFISTFLILFLIFRSSFKKNINENSNSSFKFNNFINVAYAIDKNYHYIAHVSMKSIMLSQNKDTYIIFHILFHSEIEDKEKKEIIDKICIEYKNCEIKYYYMGERYKELNVKGYITWSTAIYYRLRLPDLLYDQKRVLYLDCDTLVYKDLTKIYNYNITGKYFTGMLEPRKASDLGLNIKNYINTGVMLFNLDELRKNDIPKKIEDYLIKHNFRITFPVNDSVNAVCHERNGYFSPEYVQWGFCNENLVNKYYNDLEIKFDKNEILKAYKDPYIYHMIGYKKKPWNGIPNYNGIVCIDPFIRFYEMAKKTDYYYTIINQFRIYIKKI